MANSRNTEIMDNIDETRATAILEQDTGRTTDIMSESARLTDIMQPDKRSTDIMGGKDSRATDVMANAVAEAIDFSRRTSIDKFKIKKVIAENTGEASLILTELDDKKFVLKLYHLNTEPDKRLTDLLSEIDSPYIMPRIQGGVYDGRVYELLPFYSNGDLEKQLPMQESFIEKTVVMSINEGLKALHDNGIIHRDIKPSNMFINKNGDRVILGDFGISSLLDGNISVRATSMSRTLGYAAPEASNGFVSKESDYYSFGITILHLLMGRDPFEGMSDMQILYQTINKTLDIPGSISPRMKHLIKGLTVKDRNNRWGYDEVKRWLEHEDVEVNEVKNFKGYKPYNFNYNKYYGLDEISLAFANDWDKAKKHLYRGLVEKNIVQYGEEYSVDIGEMKDATSDDDVAVFSMIYILNPHAPLCFRGHVYADLQALGMKMYETMPSLTELDSEPSEEYDDIMKLIKSGCLKKFIENNKYEEGFKNDLSEIIEKIESGDNNYYYALMYLLYPEMGFDFNDKKYVNLEDFVSDLESQSSSEITRTCGRLISNPLFFMWIYSLGYSKQVEEWMSIYEKAVW